MVESFAHQSHVKFILTQFPGLLPAFPRRMDHRRIGNTARLQDVFEMIRVIEPVSAIGTSHIALLILRRHVITTGTERSPSVQDELRIGLLDHQLWGKGGAE